MGVNATACAPRGPRGPDRDAGGWSAPLGSASRAPSASERAPGEPVLRWRANVHRAVAGPPAVGERIIAVTAADRTLTLLEWETGETLWRRNLGAPAAGPPLLAGDRVYAATTGRQGQVFAYELRAGARRWRTRVGAVVPPIATSPGHVFAGTERGLVVALGAARGEVRWRRTLPWPLRTGPILVGDALFVTTEDSVFLLRVSDGTVAQRAASVGTITAPAAFTGDALIVTSPDGLIAALARDDLSTLWSVRTGDPIFGLPAIARDTAFAVTLAGTLWRVPLAHPDRHLAVPLGVTVRAPPAPVADGVLIGSTAGEILFTRGHGPVEVRARVDGPIEQAPIVHRGVLLVIDGRGRVYTWR